MLRQLLLSDFGTEGPAAGNGWALVHAEFPTVVVGPLLAGRGAHVLRLDVSEWGSLAFDPFDWDGRVFGAAERCERLALHLEGARGEALVIAALEILTRYQGLVGRRNEASSARLFDRVLARHRALHDLGLPRVRADYQHALDAWQWALRLRPDADLAVQAAALFHDVERLLTEADRGVEHPAPDSQAGKDAHAARGAELTCQVLEEVGADEPTCRRVKELVARHEHPSGDADLALIDDADALSFFSLNASGFIRYFDPEHSRRKVANTLARLRPEQLRRLAQMRLAPGVRNLLDAQLSAIHEPRACQPRMG
ncbi:DUF4202 family protein [Pyxidicoccus xibeiensis]|uniref:DUF4202 family protein n=1 Tax=Pyxidicoccus xibeiensis TaxID=2906759 RepID=UPI0020A7EDE1|nr:DUF4202 family protein [Pyxidicoccus xibeiensis]MCP3136032.1 DUF4202 domain-containing protein [Pyxidicoccus xibeiensis]